jgi:hypothetical protein
MVKLDLDDLPPRLAAALEALSASDELMLLRAGVVVARLRVGESAASPAPESVPPEGMKEIMEHFEAMIEDQF